MMPHLGFGMIIWGEKACLHKAQKR
jgi:hypothetical protein